MHFVYADVSLGREKSCAVEISRRLQLTMKICCATGMNTFVQVLNPAAFGGFDAFEQQTSFIAASARASPPVAGGNKVIRFCGPSPLPPLSLVCVRVLSGRVLSQSGPAALKTSESGARVCHVRYERLEKQHCGTRLTACSTAWSFIQVRWRHYWQLRKISALPTYLSLSDIIQLLFLYNHKGFEVAPISVARNVPGSQKRHTSAWRSTQLDGQALVCLISDMNQ